LEKIALTIAPLSGITACAFAPSSQRSHAGRRRVNGLDRMSLSV
jgi:hypothetical protein